MLRLYTYFRSSSAYRVRIALNLKGLEHELIPVHLVKDGGAQRKPEYVEKNPMGQVPLLEHGEFRLTQSLPILMYLDELSKDPALFSEDSRIRLQQIELCEIINSGIQPIQNLKVLQYLRNEFNAEADEVKAWSSHWIESGFNALEKRLRDSAGSFSFGEQPSVLDCFIVPQVFNARRFDLNMKDFPTISRIEQNCMDIEAFQKAQPSAQPDAE